MLAQLNYAEIENAFATLKTLSVLKEEKLSTSIIRKFYSKNREEHGKVILEKLQETFSFFHTFHLNTLAFFDFILSREQAILAKEEQVLLDINHYLSKLDFPQIFETGINCNVISAPILKNSSLFSFYYEHFKTLLVPQIFVLERNSKDIDKVEQLLIQLEKFPSGVKVVEEICLLFNFYTFFYHRFYLPLSLFVEEEIKKGKIFGKFLKNAFEKDFPNMPPLKQLKRLSFSESLAKCTNLHLLCFPQSAFIIEKSTVFDPHFLLPLIDLIELHLTKQSKLALFLSKHLLINNAHFFSSDTCLRKFVNLHLNLYKLSKRERADLIAYQKVNQCQYQLLYSLYAEIKGQDSLNRAIFDYFDSTNDFFAFIKTQKSTLIYFLEHNFLRASFYKKMYFEDFFTLAIKFFNYATLLFSLDDVFTFVLPSAGKNDKVKEITQLSLQLFRRSYFASYELCFSALFFPIVRISALAQCHLPLLKQEINSFSHKTSFFSRENIIYFLKIAELTAYSKDNLDNQSFFPDFVKLALTEFYFSKTPCQKFALSLFANQKNKAAFDSLKNTYFLLEKHVNNIFQDYLKNTSRHLSPFSLLSHFPFFYKGFETEEELESYLNTMEEKFGIPKFFILSLLLFVNQNQTYLSSLYNVSSISFDNNEYAVSLPTLSRKEEDFILENLLQDKCYKNLTLIRSFLTKAPKENEKLIRFISSLTFSLE